ncbi:DNA/RNA nuclease SfsA [Stygiolobus caldivivus]
MLVLVFRSDAVCFSPNFDTDKCFSMTFIRALREGVRVEVKTFYLEDEKLYYKGDIPLCQGITR